MRSCIQSNKVFHLLARYFQIIIKYCYIFALSVDYFDYFYYLCQPIEQMINYGTKRYIF